PRVLPLRHPAGDAGLAPGDHAQEHGRHEHRHPLRGAGRGLLDRAAPGRHDRRPLGAPRHVLVPGRHDRDRQPLHRGDAKGRPQIAALLKWLGSTSNRTFILWPLALLALEAAIQQGTPRVHWWATPLLAWGYLQYKLVGTFRAR